MKAIVKQVIFNGNQRYDVGETVDTKVLGVKQNDERIELIEEKKDNSKAKDVAKAPKTNETKTPDTKPAEEKKEVTQNNKMVTSSETK